MQRDSSSKLVAGVLAIGLSAAAYAATPLAVPSKPNIVFILADDLGWADVGFNGGVIPTPNLDKLAREGVRLTQHYVAPVCTPTRAGLLTGRYWTRFGVFGIQATQCLPFDTVTLPRALKSVGYDTALMGKWHLGSALEWGPNHFGFDYSYGSLGGGVGPFNHFYKKGPYMQTWHRNNEFITEAGHVTDLIGDEAVKWIIQRGAAPFFVYLPFTAPHLPVKEPLAWLDKVPDDVVHAVERRFAEQKAITLPFYATSHPTLTDNLARHYAACVMHLDYEIGRVVEALEKTGKRKNTLIVFSSDNGSPTGVENADRDFPPDGYAEGPIPGGNRPLRGFKDELYEGGIHVPALANWPGILTPGKVQQAVAIIDWMPTICALAGYTPQTDLKWDGMNIWSFLTGKATQIAARQLYTGFHTDYVFRDGDWKLIVTKVKNGTAAMTELFDLSRDPYETTDLARQESPERLKSLERAHEEMAKSDRDSMPPTGGREKQPQPPPQSGAKSAAAWLRRQFRDE